MRREEESSNSPLEESIERNRFCFEKILVVSFSQSRQSAAYPFSMGISNTSFFKRICLLWMIVLARGFQGVANSHRTRSSGVTSIINSNSGRLSTTRLFHKDQSTGPRNHNQSPFQRSIHALLKRSNTLESSAGIGGVIGSGSSKGDIPMRALTSVMASAPTKLGFWGHFGLSLTSIVLVKSVYRLFILKQNNETEEVSNEQPAGILNRCPWPFIFFHDYKQGFKDSPTWMVVTWIILWKLSRKLLIQQ